MTQLEKSFDSILSNFELDFKHEILVLYKSDIFFISIERLLFSLTILPMKQQDKVLRSVQRYQSNKPLFMNLLHDLAKPILSIKS
tara:strand:- start:1116 stop:1370 length:255 start_codon:yes stop_codon:yes gene_type:complete